MKTSLPNRNRALGLLSMLAILALANTSTGQVSGREIPPSAVELLRDAGASLSSESSFQAEFRHRVGLLGQEMVGTGVYRQMNHRNLRKHRLEITLRVGEESSSIQQASNGRFLWIRRDFPGQRSVRRLDLREVRKALRANNVEAADNPLSPILTGYDGLPSTLAGIASRFEFVAPRPTKIGDQPAWLLEGRWNAETLRKLAPAFSPDDPHLNRLPSHLPTHIVIVLSRAPEWPLFPYRIEYRRAKETYADAVDSTEPIVTMEFFNVLRRARFDAREFEFPADDDVEQDVTSQFIERLAAKQKQK